MQSEGISFESRVEPEAVILAWKGPSRPFRQTGKQTLTVPMVIAILVGLILLVAGEWMLIAVVAALVFAYYAWTVIPPEVIEYSITTRGITAKGKLYEWREFSRWWTEEKWGQELLVLEAPGQTIGRMIVPLGETNEDRVEKIMERMLVKDRPADTAMDRAGKWLGEKFPLENKI